MTKPRSIKLEIEALQDSDLREFVKSQVKKGIQAELHTPEIQYMIEEQIQSIVKNEKIQQCIVQQAVVSLCRSLNSEIRKTASNLLKAEIKDAVSKDLSVHVHQTLNNFLHTNLEIFDTSMFLPHIKRLVNDAVIGTFVKAVEDREQQEGVKPND